MSGERQTLLWCVQEILCRFAGTFSIANHGYAFELSAFPDAANASEAIASYRESLGLLGEDCSWQVQLQPVAAGEADVEEVLGRWLSSPFWHLDPTGFQIQKPSPLASLVVECLNKLGATHYWKVQIDIKSFYECAWDDFLTQTPDGFLFLHLAVSD